MSVEVARLALHSIHHAFFTSSVLRAFFTVMYIQHSFSQISSIAAVAILIGVPNDIIPSISESSSRVVAAGDRAAQTCLRYKIVAVHKVNEWIHVAAN